MMLMDFIRKIAGYRINGQLAEAEEEISHLYQYLEVSVDFHKKSTESFLDYLVNEKKFTNSKLEIVAFLLKEQGELSLQKELKFDYYKKSYFLLEKVERESTLFSMERQMKLVELRNYLEKYP